MSDAGPFGTIGSTLLRPASWAFGAVVALRNRGFDRGNNVRRVPLPVISIGNISVGGTGKTPHVAWTVRRLREAGHRPAIAMRGYGATGACPSDEALEYGAVVPDVPLIVHPKRVDAINRFLAAQPNAIDCVVLDDGFQHRGLARDLDIVLVDSTRAALDGALLPAGWLREPPDALRRASAVVITRAERVDDALARSIERFHGRRPIAWTRHAWRGIDVYDRAGGQRHDGAWLADKRGFGLFGVGNRAAVRRDYERSGAIVLHEFAAQDHARYSATTVALLNKVARSHKADFIFTTRKDWMKIAPYRASSEFPFAVPDLAIEFVAGESEFTAMVVEAAQARR